MTSTPNFYDILEVQADATPEEIRHAYRQIVKRVHPDTRKSGATTLFHSVQQAYETLSDEYRRQAYDAMLGVQLPPRKRPAFRLGLQISHPHLRPMPEPQMLYALMDIEAAAHVKPKHADLNLCFALDHSLSMDGARLLRAQEAAEVLINKLRPVDYVSIVAFSDRARVVLSGQRGDDRAVAVTSLGSIQPWGGTELLQGLNAGLEQLRLWRSPSTVDHLILLTDGQTYGDEAGCLDAARKAGQEKIGLTLLGLGSDWNDQLLDEMAAVSGGYATYVDSPSRLISVFEQRLQALANVTARDLRLCVNLAPTTEIAGAFRLTPDIARLQLENGQYLLGALEFARPSRVLLELRSITPLSGRAEIAAVALSGELLHTHVRAPDSEAKIVVDVQDAPSSAPSPAAFDTVLASVAVFKVQEKALAEVERGEQRQATSRLRHLATHLMDLGDPELAEATLREASLLARTGHLSAEGRKQIRYGTRSLSTEPNRQATD
jgi:Ca-activated chloride channel family protein